MKHSQRRKVRNVALIVFATMALIAGNTSIVASAAGTSHQQPLTHVDWDEIESVKIWLKVFIPGEMPGLTMPVPGAPGKTMIPGPSETVNDCFHTDHRDFSSAINAESRTHAETVIDVKARGLRHTVDYAHPTTEVDCESGEVECQLVADPSVQFNNFQTVTDSSQGRIFRVELVGRASNPCFTGAPDIDFNGVLNVVVSEVSEGSGKLQKATLEFVGMVEPFPAFEMYAAVDDGAARTVFTLSRVDGATPFNLLGDASRAVTGRATFSIVSVGQRCSGNRVGIDVNGNAIACVYSREYRPDGVWVPFPGIGVHDVGEPCDPSTDDVSQTPAGRPIACVVPGQWMFWP